MSEVKKRHGCLTTYLWFIVVVNSLVTLFYIFGSQTIRESSPSLPFWAIPVLTIGTIFNVVFAIALFKWKMWGFLGFVATSILAFVINLTIGINIFQALLGFIGVAILYGVLQIGDKANESLTLDSRSGLPALPPGATPEQIASQKQLEEQKRLLHSKPTGWSQLE